jgi:hypothetical protein
MKLQKLTICLSLLAAALLASCGSPGVPLPPALELPRPVTDLHAVRKGDQVHLTWSASTETTDHHNIKHPGPIEVCRNAGSAIRQCGTPVTKIESPKPAAGKNAPKIQMSYTDQLPPKLQSGYPTSNIFYSVNVLNSYGRSAGLSNQVPVPAAPTLAPPSDFQAQLGLEGVRLSWKPLQPPQEIPGLRYVVRVYRREQGKNADAVAGEVPVSNESSPDLLDRSFEWEKTYNYRATVVTFVAQPGSGEQQVEGEDTASVSVVAHDVFPPAVPSGLQAVFSGPGQKPFIDLIWTPNTEADLGGYNIYRRDPDGQAVKLNSELVKAPAFRDSEVLSGHQYFYSVSAVDLRGNESGRSPETTETVP